MVRSLIVKVPDPDRGRIRLDNHIESKLFRRGKVILFHLPSGERKKKELR